MRPLVFLGFLAVFMMVQLLSSVASVGMEGLFQLFGYTMADSAAAATGPSSTLSMFLYVGIAGPVAEELIYRGFVMRRLEKYGSFFAILFSSLLFGIMHTFLIPALRHHAWEPGSDIFCIGSRIDFRLSGYGIFHRLVDSLTYPE